MSAWRVMASELYAMGGQAPYDAVAGLDKELQRLRELGLAVTTGKRGKGDHWVLTQLGTDYCEGRVKPHGRRGGIKFHATWLASLPRAQ
jgi:hypothetical protein